jgi:Lipocalin-like domain
MQRQRAKGEDMRITNFKTRCMGASLSLLAALTTAFLMTASHAQAPAKSLMDALVGHWQLVSVTAANERTPYGANPHGTMFLDAGGHFSTIVVSDGDARSLGYFGTYTVSDADKVITLHIEDSVGGGSPNAAGRDLKRLITLNGDELTIQNQTPAGSPGNLKIVWKRAN